MGISETTYLSYLTEKDAESLSCLMVANKERFQRYFPKTLAQNLSVSDAKSYIKKKTQEQKNKTEFTLAIKETTSQLVAGLVILKDIDWNNKEGELAYCIGENFEGKGLMTKAIIEISKTAFSKIQLSTLKIIVHKTNPASIRVAEKTGFIWKKTLLKEYTPPGELPMDMELYELERKNIL